MSNKTDTCCVCQEIHWQGSDCSHVLVENSRRGERSQAFKTALWKPSRSQLHLSCRKAQAGQQTLFLNCSVAFTETNVQRGRSRVCSVEWLDLVSLVYFLSRIKKKKKQSKKVLSFNVIKINTKCYYK